MPTEPSPPATATRSPGRRHYWFTVRPLERHREGTDSWAVGQGYVSLTPLRLDLTDREELARMRADDTRHEPTFSELP